MRPCSKFALSNFYASRVQKFLGDGTGSGDFCQKIRGAADASEMEFASAVGMH